MNRRLSLLFLFPLALCGAGCNSTHVVYVQDTVLGVDVSVTSEGNNRISVGFDRNTYALVPRYTPEAGKAEAMSVTSVSNVKVAGLDDIVFNHFIATGSAAQDAATDPQGLKMMREAVFGEEGGGE